MPALDRLLLIALNMIPQIGPKRIMQIAEKFSSLSDLYEATNEDLLQIKGINNKLSSNIMRHIKKFDPNSEIKKAQLTGASLITIIDKDYPSMSKAYL
jgi:DNA processing protein